MPEDSILVVGGNGFVGKYICNRLMSLRYRVISLSRKQYDTTGYISVRGDIADKSQLYDIIKKYKINSIIHLASLLNTKSREDPGNAVRVNVVGSLNLLELCSDLNIHRFIYGSSYNAIGKPISNKEEEVDETVPSFPEEFYGETKRFVEVLGNAMAEKDGFEFISARIPIVVGAGAKSPTSMWRSDIFSKINEPGKITIGFTKDEVLPLSHAEDIANAMTMLVVNKTIQYSIYNLPSESIMISDLIKILNKINNKLVVECGNQKLKGMPQHVSWERFRTEFNYKLLSIQSRIEEQVRP